ncbi:unnamed protein product [Blepharisma stoltei]|uniref:J domain-containing protein n=1 Tax=Blepharisma stoltei TaxID=1481888 RepID=A0AAU9JX49_9CILI|nr:unnamed protein product [Blepharisma stoltei]
MLCNKLAYRYLTQSSLGTGKAIMQMPTQFKYLNCVSSRQNNYAGFYFNKNIRRPFGTESRTRENLTKEDLDDMTYYEILGVSPKANSNQIRKAYLNLARKKHPDLQEEPTTEFSYIVKAYQTLMDDQQRAIYDDSLVNDKEYYGVGFGRFKINLKFIFLLTVSGLIYALVNRENSKSENLCPNDHKMKKLDLSKTVVETKKDESENEQTAFEVVLKKKRPQRVDNSLVRNPKSAPIFAKKAPKNIIEEEDIIDEPIVLPKHKSIETKSL